jgi:hypothetical protein
VRNKISEHVAKIRFYDPAIGYESLWALPIGEAQYRLENLPFFIYDIAVGDVITASKDDSGDLHFLTVMEGSNNRTLRARSDDRAS